MLNQNGLEPTWPRMIGAWVGQAQALGDLLTAATLHTQERRVVHDVSQASAASAISFEPK